MIEIDEDIKGEYVIKAGRYITMQEYADMIGLKYSTVRKKVSLGKIDSVIIDGKRMIKLLGKFDFNSERTR